MPAKDREQLVEEAFYPVSSRRGTSYPCRQRDLDSIREPSGRNYGPFVNQRQATRELVQHNDPRRRPSSSEREAIRRLSDAVYDAGRYGWGPDLAIKSFLDLDTVFFGGALRGYVGVSWEHRECFNDDGEVQGHTSGVQEAMVTLNAEAILMETHSFLLMFSTVLHEMCVGTILDIKIKYLLLLIIVLTRISMPSNVCESIMVPGIQAAMATAWSSGQGFIPCIEEQRSCLDSMRFHRANIILATMLGVAHTKGVVGAGCGSLISKSTVSVSDH